MDIVYIGAIAVLWIVGYLLIAGCDTLSEQLDKPLKKPAGESQ
jgi:hypothetical protein